MTPLLSAWLAEVVLITYRSAKQQSVGKGVASPPIAGLPLPSEYAASFIIYGALAFIPGEGAKVATAIGWGLVVATFLNLWDPATIGNPGGPAVKGGPSTKSATAAPVVSPASAQSAA